MSTENATQNANANANLGNLLEQAVRNKLRFDSPKGQLTVEDLFDLTSTPANMNMLDAIAVGLDSQLKAKADKVVSFIKPTPTKTDFTQLKLDIVLYVLNEKMAERDARIAAADKAEKKQRLLAALEAAEQGELSQKSPAEIRKMLEEL